MSESVLVIGGGISGLSTAHFLARDGVDVRLVEARAGLGGTLGTESADGFLFERGANGFLDGAPQTLELARDLGLEEDLIEASPKAKARYILRNGRLHAIPAGPLGLVRFLLGSRLLSLRGRLRLLAEYRQPPGNSNEEDTVATFGRRRFGREATEFLLDPLVTGIYGGDVERLSLKSSFPRFAEMEARHGSLVRAFRKGRSSKSADGEKKSSRRGKLRSFRRGMEELVRAIGDSLGDRVTLESPVESVAGGKGSLEVTFRGGSKETFDRVVVAVPAPRAAHLFGSAHPDLCAALETIFYASIAVVCLGYRREDVGHPLDGYGFLVPSNQGLRTLGMIWTSSLFPEHAPEGTVSLRAMIGGARDPEVVGKPAEELERIVLDEVGGIIGIAGKPVARSCYRYTQGIPQYNVGHARRIQAIETQTASIEGLHITGNAYRGVAVNDCVREGELVAREVLRKMKVG